MSTYITSDIHGYLDALKEAIELAGIGPDDELYVLGDLIDRGPNPVGVIQYLRDMPNAHVLMGNHEQLMLAALDHVAPPTCGHFDMSTMDVLAFADWLSWTQNGGGTTITQLEQLTEDDYLSLLAWVRNLSFYETVTVAERSYILVHAGINPAVTSFWLAEHPEADLTSTSTLDKLLAEQSLEDIVWIRRDFWSNHTGLINADGMGPVVIAGHTPSLSLMYCTDEDAAFSTLDGKGTIVPLGADESTGGVADRIDIDCAAAAGQPNGRVGIMRLDDGEQFFADVSLGA